MEIAKKVGGKKIKYMNLMGCYYLRAKTVSTLIESSPNITVLGCEGVDVLGAFEKLSTLLPNLAILKLDMCQVCVPAYLTHLISTRSKFLILRRYAPSNIFAFYLLAVVSSSTWRPLIQQW